MIFKHELEISPELINEGLFIELKKKKGASDLGLKIMEYYPFAAVPFADNRYKMEIIAFSWQQWKEFRDQLNYTVSLTGNIRLLQAVRFIIESMEQGIPDGKENTERV